MMRHVTLAILLVVTGPTALFAQAKPNLITRENANRGTFDWILTKVVREDNEPYSRGWHRRKLVEGFVSTTSASAGDTVDIYVSTEPADKYRLDIYRMGYYGGRGGRLMRSIGPLQGVVQPTPSDGAKNLVECKWTKGTSLRIPNDWVSGVYVGKLSTATTDGEAYVIFVVRDSRNADLMFQTSDTTWLAYNRWPNWRSLYDLGDNPWGAGGSKVGYDVSFDRPYALYWNLLPTGFEPLTNGAGEFFLTEFSLAFWLEREGYDVTYVSNIDTHTDGKGLLRSKAFLSVGHDEVLDRADVRERDQSARCGRQPRVPLRQQHLRDRGAAAEHRRTAEPGDAQGQGVHHRARADGIDLVWRRPGRLDRRAPGSLGLRGHRHEERRSRPRSRRLGIPRSAARQPQGHRRAGGGAGGQRPGSAD